MITAIIIALVAAVVTLLCVNRILRADAIAQRERARRYLRFYSDLWDRLVRERNAYAASHDAVNAERKSSIELARQIKQRVQPMILIMRPMLDALEAMDLPEFEEPDSTDTSEEPTP